MTWLVYYENVNTRKIEKWNVFRYSAFHKEVQDMYKIYDTKNSFAMALNDTCRYYFWYKCEYEVIISEWPPVNKERFPTAKRSQLK